MLDFENNTADTTTYTGESLDLANLGVPTKISSVTAVTDKKAEKAIKKAEREAKKTAADAVKAAKAEERAKAKADKDAATVSAKEERERIRAATFQRISPLLKVGDALAKQHDGYVTQYVTNANADLYVLLKEIQAFAEQVLASADADAAIKQMRENLRWDHEIKTQANSPALNIIVRYVTRTNRKNACVYARVIRKAMADGITSAELTEYIVKANGIDNIREAVAKKAPDIEDVKTKAGIWEYAESFLKAQVAKPMATFKLGYEHSAYMADTARGGRFHYFVCEFDQGEYKVVDVLLMDKDLEQQMLDRVFSNLMQQTILTQEDVDLRNAIEAKLGLKRTKPLVANACTGN
jgi:hypothetical protein